MNLCNEYFPNVSETQTNKQKFYEVASVLRMMVTSFETEKSQGTRLAQTLTAFLYLFSSKFEIIATVWIGGGRVVRWCWVNFQCRGVLLIWIRVGQGPTALAMGAGGGCLDIFTLIYHFSFLSPSLSGRRPDIDWNTVSKGR